jgi:hypothetical protein
MQLKEQKLFATPSSQQDLEDRIKKIADGSGNAAAVWTAVMLFNNFVAATAAKETQ